MKNTFIPTFALLFMFLTASVQTLQAQDTLKKTSTVKKAVVKPLAIDPATGKPRVPINPKTGKPYSKYGYGYYSKYKNAGKAAHTADSLKKAAALKTTVAPAPVVVPPVTPPVTEAPIDKSLNGQYHYLLTKVYNYQQPLVSALWKNVIDTLNAGHRKLTDAQAKIAEQAKTISGLQADATTKDQLNAKADEISLFGVDFLKSTYNLMMWGLVIVLGAIAAIVIARSGKHRYDANYRTNLYNELEEEFKTYKTKANDKEKKLARELQTERNKVDELMGRG